MQMWGAAPLAAIPGCATSRSRNPLGHISSSEMDSLMCNCTSKLVLRTPRNDGRESRNCHLGEIDRGPKLPAMFVRLTRPVRAKAGWFVALLYLFCVLAPGVALALGDAASCLVHQFGMAAAAHVHEAAQPQPAASHQHHAMQRISMRCIAPMPATPCPGTPSISTTARVRRDRAAPCCAFRRSRPICLRLQNPAAGLALRCRKFSAPAG